MDSSAIQTRTSDSTNQVIVHSKRDLFLSSFHDPQSWSLPDSIIYHITHNPTTAKAYQKIITLCKYFFIKNPIIVMDEICWDYEWEANELYNLCWDWKTVASKIWITDVLIVHLAFPSFEYLFPRIYRCDVVQFDITQDMSFNDFKFLTTNVEKFSMSWCIVKDNDGGVVPIEKLVAVLSKIKKIVFFNNPDNSSITKNTVKELSSLSHFGNISFFEFANISDIFDIDTFFTYIKNNKQIKCSLWFDDISLEYSNRLEAIVDEILETTTHNYKPLLIQFERLIEEKYLKLESLFHEK